MEENREKKIKATNLSISEILYRGQRNYSWKLETTLDRSFETEVALDYYYKIIRAAKPKIETFADSRWQLCALDEYKDWLSKVDTLAFRNFKEYEYFAYLRHHGFPSPLLDWTVSPYIAAFFAFNDAKYKDEYVSVYAFQEFSHGGKTINGDEVFINSLGPYAKVYKRHFLQQSRYTVCTVKKKGGVYYARHEDIVKRNQKEQDLLWKFNLPVKEKKTALNQLNKMNINAFSLFGTEDSLLETIATNEIFLEGRNL